MAIKKSKGNMYSWISHTHVHLGGECPHKCTYCYVNNPRFGRPEKYKGDLRLIEKELLVNYGKGKTIFVENCNDLFAEEVASGYILRILSHCRQYYDNVYVFQTKNPKRVHDFDDILPDRCLLGVTVETNRDIPDIGNAPMPIERLKALFSLHTKAFKRFITIEPILDFDVVEFADLIFVVSPDFVNIGADSKGHGLQEPSWDKVQGLIERLNNYDIEIREKSNLERLRKRGC